MLLPPSLTESQAVQVQLDDEQAEVLAELGRRLAGKKTWWGAAEESERAASVISLRRSGSKDEWTLRVNDAVGVISIGGQSISVLPKIPPAHLLYLLGKAQVVPRMDADSVSVDSGFDLFELLARWFVGSVEILLRRDLSRDYRGRHDVLGHVRGRVHVVATSLAVLQGRPHVTCEFDELDRNTPLNRVLLASLLVVARCPLASDSVRSRARRACSRFDDVSPMRPGDLRITPDSTTRYYRDSHLLARTILGGSARQLDTGDEVGWTFLLRTPEAVEEGVRAELAEALAPTYVVRKGRLTLTPSTRTLNPDLTFDHLAVGDVKYKVLAGEYSTSDLYQGVTFATGYRVRHTAIVSFSTGPAEALSDLQVGDVTVANLVWNADHDRSPRDAGAELVSSARRWLDSMNAGRSVRSDHSALS